MSRTRRKNPADASERFTVMDELLASPTEPAPPEVHAHRITMAHQALELLRTPETANITAWSVCCMVGNTLETMLRQGLAQDPDGLLQDAFDALKRAASAVRAPGEPISIPPSDYATVANMVEDWSAIMLQAPARAIISTFRQTDRRIREIEAGRVSPDDYAVTMGAARNLGARM